MTEHIKLDLDAIEARAVAAKVAHPGNPWFYQEKSDAYTHIVRVENPALNNSLIVAQLGQRTDGVSEATARHIAGTNPDVTMTMVRQLRDVAPMPMERRMDILRRHLGLGVVITHTRCMGIIEEHHFTAWGNGERWVCGNPTRKPKRLTGSEYPVDDIAPGNITHLDRVPLAMLDYVAKPK